MGRLVTSVCIVVTPAAMQLPDADTDVLVWDASSPIGQLGAYVGHDGDGAIWVDAQGARIHGVTYWSEMPCIPTR